MILEITLNHAMPTKDELQEEINDRLETDIEWSKLDKDDLVEFDDMLDKPDTVQLLAAKQANEIAGGTVEDKVKSWRPGQIVTLAMSDEVGVRDVLFK